MPRKRNKNGVYLTEIGTDTAKEQIYNRFTLTPEGDEPLPGAVHFPNRVPSSVKACAALRITQLFVDIFPGRQ